MLGMEEKMYVWPMDLKKVPEKKLIRTYKIFSGTFRPAECGGTSNSSGLCYRVEPSRAKRLLRHSILMI